MGKIHRLQFSDTKLEKLFDEWSRLADLCAHAYKVGGVAAEYQELCVKRDQAWDKYEAAAQLDQHYEEEARHDEARRGIGECENVDE